MIKVPTESIRTRKDFTDEEREIEKRRLYEEATSKIRSEKSMAHYKKGREAYRLHIPALAIRELETAYEKDTEVLQLADDQRASKYFGLAMWQDSLGNEAQARRFCQRILKEFGHSTFAEAARGMMDRMDRRSSQKNYKRTFTIVEKEKPKPAAKPEPKPITTAEVPETKPATVEVEEVKPEPAEEAPASTGQTKQETEQITSASAGKELEEANQFFDRAMGAYRAALALPSNERNPKLIQAEKDFEKAIDLYQKAQRKDPSNQAIESRLTDANMFLYGTRKYRTLF